MKPAVFWASAFTRNGLATVAPHTGVSFFPASVTVLATDFNAASDVLVAATMDDGNTAVFYVTYDAWRAFNNL